MRLKVFSRAFDSATVIAKTLVNRDGLVSVKQLQKAGVSRSYCIRIFKVWTAKKLVKSREGRSGGYSTHVKHPANLLLDLFDHDEVMKARRMMTASAVITGERKSENNN